MTFDADGIYVCQVDYSPDTPPIRPSLRVYVYRTSFLQVSLCDQAVLRAAGHSALVGHRIGDESGGRQCGSAVQRVRTAARVHQLVASWRLVSADSRMGKGI